MGSIKTGIELQDNFTSTLDRITNAVNVSTVSMYNMQQAMNSNIDVSGINEATYAVQEMNNALNSVSPDITPVVESFEVPVTPVVAEQPQIDVPDAVEVPVVPVVTEQPQIDVPDGIEVPVMPVVTEQPQLDIPDDTVVDISVSGVDKSEQMIAELTTRLNEVSRMQEAINSVGNDMYVLPDDAVKSISVINTELTRMEQTLKFIQSNPFKMDASVAELQIQSVSDALDKVMAKQQELDELMGSVPSQVINVDINPVLPDPLIENPDAVPIEIQPNAPPDPVEIPVVWQTDNLDVFASTGIERFEQEVQSANTMLERLSNTQNAIAKQAYNTMIFPPEAAQNLNTMAVRIDNIRNRIQQMESNPVNLGTDTANAGLEQLRSQLDQAIRAQNELNNAVQNMDVSAANEAYLDLSQTVGNTERYIRDNVDEQGRFNTAIQRGTKNADNLVNTIVSAAAAYLSIQTVEKVLDISDELTQTTARVNMMNDGLQSTPELINMIYAAAQDARGSFSDMAAVVAKLGNNAGDAFSSSEEIVAFADLVQKEMNLAGASTQEASNAMLQLTQALGSGVLRGDELNSIFEQAPNLIQNISSYIQDNEDIARSMADAIGVSYEEMATNAQGHIRDIASEGLISADIVKTAIFAASDEINENFESMPMTWSQIWQQMKNTALIAFQPVLNKINDLANSAQVQAFVNNAIGLIATLANYALEAFDLMAQAASWVSNNWSVIEPIVWGIVAALGAYAIVAGKVAVANAVMAVKQGIHTLATIKATEATFAQKVGQYGLNAALAACPITWIVAGIIALIAVILAVTQYTGVFASTATSSFGIVTGGINVVIQFFKNLGLSVANIALGIGNAINALASNMMTAFNNAITNIQSWFYDLLAAAVDVIEGICAELNKLPFVEFDYSGLTNAADEYATKAAELAGSKGDYQSISDAFNEGYSTFDAYSDGWVSDAFSSGASWGDGIADKLSSLTDFTDAASSLPNVSDYTSGFSDVASNAVANGIDSSGLGDSAASTAGSADSISDALDITNEDLKYLRDIAEQDAINKFTTAEITIEQTNNNNISSDMDLDGVIDGLTGAVNEAVDTITEGVH